MKKFMLKMRARRTKMQGRKECKQAAFTYMALKAVMLLLAYLFLTCKGCEYSHFIRQGVHLFLFSHFIYAGMRVTSTILGSICLFRGSAYFVNFFYKKTFLMALPFTNTNLTVLNEEGAGNWVFLLNGFLTYAIAIMIFRALRARFRKSTPVPKRDGTDIGLSAPAT